MDDHEMASSWGKRESEAQRQRHLSEEEVRAMLGFDWHMLSEVQLRLYFYSPNLNTPNPNANTHAQRTLKQQGGGALDTLSSSVRLRRCSRLNL